MQVISTSILTLVHTLQFTSFCCSLWRHTIMANSSGIDWVEGTTFTFTFHYFKSPCFFLFHSALYFVNKGQDYTFYTFHFQLLQQWYQKWQDWIDVRHNCMSWQLVFKVRPMIKKYLRNFLIVHLPDSSVLESKQSFCSSFNQLFSFSSPYTLEAFRKC